MLSKNTLKKYNYCVCNFSIKSLHGLAPFFHDSNQVKRTSILFNKYWIRKGRFRLIFMELFFNYTSNAYQWEGGCNSILNFNWFFFLSLEYQAIVVFFIKKKFAKFLWHQQKDIFLTFRDVSSQSKGWIELGVNSFDSPCLKRTANSSHNFGFLG